MKNDLVTPNLLSRRRLLMRAGLAAGAAYMAPAMVGLNAARASGTDGGGSQSSDSSSSGPSSSSTSGPSRSSGSEGKSSGPSRQSRPSRSGRRGSDDAPRWLKKLFPAL